MRFEYKAYRRFFRKEFANAHGAIPSREGAIVRISDDEGREGFGEIAPLVDFGTETLISALAGCAQLEQSFHPEASRAVWSRTPCLAHAVTAALEMMTGTASDALEVKPAWPICALMPGEGWEEELDGLRAAGFRTLKLKIGVESFEIESRRVAELCEEIEGDLSIRLDANGGLDLRGAIQWLELSTDLGVEFIEQPLAKGEEESMAKLAGDYPTPLALDESVVSPDEIKRMKDAHWPGLMVVKPLIAGDLTLLREELRQGGAYVYSSALESKFGAATALRLALEFRGESRMALGFGADRLFAKDNFGFRTEPFLQSDNLPRIDDLSNLWSQI